MMRTAPHTETRSVPRNLARSGTGRRALRGPAGLLRAATCSLIALAVVTPLVASAQEAALAPETVAAIDDVFADIEATGPGCAAGVIADFELVYGDGFGTANADYGVPITPRTNFYLGSVGKQFTAAALVHAARAGHLSLDDPLAKWFPELPAYEPTITLRHLVHHTSGLRDYLELTLLAGWSIEAPHSVDEIVELLARQRATNFPAGEEYLYSNTGYFLLAETVKRATGRSLRTYAEDELLGPLGMTRTRIYDDHTEPLPDRAVGYTTASGELRMDHPWGFDQVGSGGVWSSVEELVHWDRNFYTEEVGGSGFTEQLLERGVLVSGDTIPYAFGIAHGAYRGLRTVAHGGALAGFRSNLLRFPDERTTVVVLCNFPNSDPGGRARQVADIVLAERLEPVVAEAPEEEGDAVQPTERVELTAQQLDRFVGHWRASMGIEIELRREGEGLVFVQGDARVPVTVVSESELRLEPIDVEMVFSDLREGAYHHQDVEQRGEPFTAERFDPQAPSSGEVGSLLGEYFSEELDTTWRIVEREDGAVLEGAGGEDLRIRVVEEARVRLPVGVLLLERDAEGVVQAFRVNTGRVRGVRFERTEGGR